MLTLSSLHKYALSYRKIVLFFCYIFIVSISLLLISKDMYFIQISHSAAQAYTSGDEKQAVQLYQKLSDHPYLGYISKQNQATIAYNKKNFVDARNLLSQSLLSGCVKKDDTKSTSTEKTTNLLLQKNKYCDVISYNFGNTLYRIGEMIASSSISTTSSAVAIDDISVSTTNNNKNKKVQEMWYQAISLYQNDIAINPEDIQAQENIDFILKKLQSNDTNDQSKKSENNTETKESDQSDKNSNNSKSQESTQNKGGGDDKEVDDYSTAQNKKTDNESIASTKNKNNKKTDNTQLTNEASKQVDDYMDKLDQQSQRLQNYFRQNPNNTSQTQKRNGIFNDPFFEQFFGQYKDPTFDDNISQSLDKDW